MVVKKNNKSYFFIILICALILDQLTKYLASKITESLPLIKEVIHLTFAKNTGVIFGLFPGYGYLLLWLYVVVIGLLMYFHNEFPSDRFSRIMLALIFAGVIGNFLDRVMFGYVIDFIDFRIWPVFNLADIYLNIGIIGIVIKSLIDSRKEK